MRAMSFVLIEDLEDMIKFMRLRILALFQTAKDGVFSKLLRYLKTFKS